MNAREMAYDILKEVIQHGQYANLLMRKQLKEVKEIDRGFITELVYGTLRNQRYLRYQWEHFTNSKTKEELAILLDMSVYQCFWMNSVPDFAAIAETLKLTDKMANKKATAFAHAILQKVVKQGRIEAQSKVEIERIALETSHPDWMVSILAAHYGLDKAIQICKANLLEAPVCGRVNTMKCSRADLIKQYGFVAGKRSPVAIQSKDNLIRSEAFKEGFITIQDEASQLIAILLDPQPNEKVLDVCSAPGTKTLQMAQMMDNQGSITALDIHEHRLELVAKAAQTTGIEIIKLIPMDASHVHELLSGQTFDKILVDVPCSGMGVLRRKPDIKFRVKPEDLDDLILSQEAILNASCQLLVSKGFLVYSTCTLNLKENERQIQKFLKTHEDFKLISEETVFPFDLGGDGFYMAKLQRN